MRYGTCPRRRGTLRHLCSQKLHLPPLSLVRSCLQPRLRRSQDQHHEAPRNLSRNLRIVPRLALYEVIVGSNVKFEEWPKTSLSPITESSITAPAKSTILRPADSPISSPTESAISLVESTITPPPESTFSPPIKATQLNSRYVMHLALYRVT